MLNWIIWNKTVLTFNSVYCPVDCRIHWLHFCRRVRPTPIERPGYDTKQSEKKVVSTAHGGETWQSLKDGFSSTSIELGYALILYTFLLSHHLYQCPIVQLVVGICSFYVLLSILNSHITGLPKKKKTYICHYGDRVPIFQYHSVVLDHCMGRMITTATLLQVHHFLYYGTHM